MRLPLLLGLLLSFSALLLAQTPAASSVNAPTPGAQQETHSPPVLPDLDRLQTASSAIDGAIGRLKIEKWKADGNSKRQAESNAESIQRNLRSALPGMIANVRSAPQDLAAQFKLYRNVNALYEVMSSVTESTGAFGPKSDYDALAQQLDVLDGIRRNLADSIEQLTASTQTQLNQLQGQVQTLQAQAKANAAPPPKKVIVDDTEPVKKSSTAHKKKVPKAPSTQVDSSGSSSGSSTPPPK